MLIGASPRQNIVVFQKTEWYHEPLIQPLKQLSRLI